MRTFTLAAIVAATTLVVGCETMKTMDTAKLTDAGSTAYKAMSLSDGDIASMSDQSCAAMDQKSQIAAPSSKYAVRLAQVVRGMPTSVNGKTANYKVYTTPSVNAWAMANGCIRVYSGLMDLMNDDELRGVIGHEIGHVALGHSKARMQTAYAASAVRGLAASAGGVAAALSQSQAGDLGEKFINAQFSQSQESAADNYSFDLLTSSKLERKGLVTSFQKLAKLSGTASTGSSMMSSHPPSADRAAAMQKRLDSGK
ncbi:M48 family metalloprotease [Variovorax sp. PAMC28562]|jgi:putative metalloprotease|uniref:M48 family metalloprotease n=1 Tax=unclassified Variovorax TaxID=663243 RepID=UPI00164DBEB8|nr:M48 family metalloprotease [Variovorax sp.]QNK75037.1 M48 family metalloprotease [Variovorax sp. PAMC28562]